MRYTKTESGLTNAQDIPKIKNFACAELVCDAVTNDELQVGEIFSVPVVNGIFEDLSSDLAEIKAYIPESTSIDNQLVNVTQVQTMIGGEIPSFDACWVRLDNVETCANTNHSNIVQIGAVIPSDAASSNQLVTNATLATCLSGKMDCTGLDLSEINQDINDLKSCPGLSCTGTLVPSDLSQINSEITSLNSCPGLSCTGTLVPSDLDTINQDITSLKSCPGLSCTGTLVASDIANKVSCEDLRLLSDRVTVVENADGLYCTGTLVPSDLDTINQDIVELKNCASITGILTTDVFSLDGNTLVITF